MKVDAPPLQLWGWVLLTFVAIQLGVGWARLITEEERALNRNRQLLEARMNNWLEHRSKSKPETFQILIVGNSLTRDAIECIPIMKEIAMENYQIPVNIGKLYLTGFKFEEIGSHYRLLDQLAAEQPDLICFQSDLLAIDLESTPRPEKGLSLLLNHIQRFFGENKLFLIQSLKTEKPVLSVKPEFCRGAMPEEPGRDTLNYPVRSRRVKTLEETAHAHAGLRKLKQLGIKLVILHIPRPSELEKKFRTEVFEREYQDVINQYAQNFGMEFWDYNGAPLPFLDFYDYGHLNQRGRKKYSRWLLEQLIREFEL